MLKNLDRDKSQKKFSGSIKKFLNQRFRPEILSSYFYVTKSKAFTHSRAAQRQAL